MRQWLNQEHKKWRVGVVAALLILNAVLSGLLLLRPGAPNRAASTAPTPTPTPTLSSAPSTQESVRTKSPSPPPSASPRPSASSEPTESPAPDLKVVPTTRTLTMSSDTQGWRATVGDCRTPGLVEATDDGGRTWQGVAPLNLTPVSRIQATDQDTVFVIGGDPIDCSTEYVISSTSGTDWQARNMQLEGLWYLTPRDRNEVRDPTLERSTPCKGEVIDLAAMDGESAAVLCADGSVRASEDAGETWDKVGTLRGGLSLGADSDHYVAALISDDCGGVAVTTFRANEQLSSAHSGCASDAEATSGEVEVAIQGETVWLWSGREFAVSEDSGRSW